MSYTCNLCIIMHQLYFNFKNIKKKSALYPIRQMHRNLFNHFPIYITFLMFRFHAVE